MRQPVEAEGGAPPFGLIKLGEGVPRQRHDLPDLLTLRVEDAAYVPVVDPRALIEAGDAQTRTILIHRANHDLNVNLYIGTVLVAVGSKSSSGQKNVTR